MGIRWRAHIRSIAYLVVLTLVLASVSIWWNARATQTADRAIQTADRAIQTAERAIETNLQQRCSSITQDASIPLPHPIAGNPSREWEADFEAIARNRAGQLHCAKARS